MNSVHFTQEGFNDLKTEQTDLKEQRVKTLIDLKAAREMGDLSENGFYKATKTRLGQIDHRLRILEYLINTASIIQNNANGYISISSTVKLSSTDGEVTYKIVGDYEANSLEGKISVRSPLGKILIGKRVNDKVILILPRSSKEYTILEIN